jgi:hypothetical protein
MGHMWGSLMFRHSAHAGQNAYEDAFWMNGSTKEKTYDLRNSHWGKRSAGHRALADASVIIACGGRKSRKENECEQGFVQGLGNHQRERNREVKHINPKLKTGEKTTMEDVIHRDRERAAKTSDRFIGHNTQASDPRACDGMQQAEKAAQHDQTAFLNDLFSYHSPRPDQIPQYQAIRSAAKHFAEVIITNTHNCADRERAITLLRQSVHMANAAVALDGRY